MMGRKLGFLPRNYRAKKKGNISSGVSMWDWFKMVATPNMAFMSMKTIIMRGNTAKELEKDMESI